MDLKTAAPIWKENTEMWGKHTCCKKIGQKIDQTLPIYPSTFDSASVICRVIIMDLAELVPGGKTPLNYQGHFPRLSQVLPTSEISRKLCINKTTVAEKKKKCPKDLIMIKLQLIFSRISESHTELHW